MAAIARWCFKHRFMVIGFWAAILMIVGVASQSLGTNYSNTFSLSDTDSTKAQELLKKVSTGAGSGETDTIVWRVDNGKVTDPAIQQRVEKMLDKVADVPEVGSVNSPYDPMGAPQISKDGKTAYAQVNFTKDFQNLDKDNVDTVISTAQDARQSGLQVELGGQAIQGQPESSSSEVIGVIAAAVVLFIAFGSLLAMTVPLITALVGLGVGLSSIGLLSHVLGISTFAPTLGALIGLGVGVDYALFIITRHRTGLMSGLSPEEAAVKALDTAGRAVIFAGMTVCVALLGLLTLRISFLGGVGIAASLVVFISVLAAITLLPALLGVYKMRVLSRHNRRKLAEEGPAPENITTGFWAKNARFVQNHSWSVAIMSLAVLAVLIIPYFSLRLGSSDQGNDPADTTTRKAYDMLADGFGPGFNGPLLVVGDVQDAKARTAFSELATTLKDQEGVANVQARPLAPDATVGVIQVIPTTSPESEETSELVDRLRDDVIPVAEKDTTMQVHVGGSTATFKDFASVIGGKLPLFIAVIVGLGFIILLVAFRSFMIPVVAALMNLLAAGAAFGVVVAVFQWGWLSEAIGAGGAGPVEAFLPVIMLAILFGLSMDYQVFLVSRMHEEWTHTKDNDRAVRVGQAETGRVITAAGAIMILVFASFVLGGQRVIAEFGVGLAAAVLIDAFIVRNFLVPAIMHHLGKANWWIPKWLDKRLPHLAIEPVEAPKKK